MHDTEPGDPDRLPARRWARRIVCLALVLACAGLTVGGWEARQATRARRHLVHAAALFDRLQTQLERGDYAASRATVVRLRRETSAAVATTGDPVWRLGG